MPRDRWTIGLGCLFAVLGVVTLAFWIPNDIESGVIETFRRQTSIGDAMAPTMVAAALLVFSVFLGLTSYLKKEIAPETAPIDSKSLIFIARLGTVLVLSVILLLFTGPLAVELVNAFGSGTESYRNVRDDFPYKYLGFVVGGCVMVAGTIMTVEHKLSRVPVLIAILSVIALILIFDVPFDDILLPPNGDF